jgi:hypothetical protein
MATKAIFLGTILSIMGILAYAVSGGQSITALIPTFIGIPILLLGLFERKDKWHKHVYEK